MLLKKTKLNVDNVKYVATMLQFLHNEKTFTVLQILCESNGLYVSELTIRSRLVQTEVSAILSKLKRYGLVSCTIWGKQRKYIINPKRFEHIAVTIKTYVTNNLQSLYLKDY